ncbi:unnamed protein product [Arctogadus glacialis]
MKAGGLRRKHLAAVSARSFMKLISGGLDVSAPTSCRGGLRDGHETGISTGSAHGVDKLDRNRQARAPATLAERLDLMRLRFPSAQASSKEMNLKACSLLWHQSLQWPLSFSD